jgi:REP element-mobilizing transposase RayT
MGLPRSHYVLDGEEGVYHCVSRCVRRAFLCGCDAVTGKDFSHRKKWIVDRLRHLASIFAIDVCAYAIMENHSHTILRTRPDIVASWSNLEVATHWIMLCPLKRRVKGKPIPSVEDQIHALADWPDRIAVLRKRLCSLSWFMAKLNEYIARAANREDKVKGRFWESRFKCQALLDVAAIAACMVYVDLNPIRAGLASTPEDSDFTSIQERIRAWHEETTALSSRSSDMTQTAQPAYAENDALQSCNAATIPASTLQSFNPDMLPLGVPANSWLCPIQSNSRKRGILQMSTSDYFDLVDRSGRMLRSDKRGFIDAELEPILNRIEAIPKAWIETVSHFGSAFWLAAGRLAHMRAFAHRLDKRRFRGLAAARSAFA